MGQQHLRSADIGQQHLRSADMGQQHLRSADMGQLHLRSQNEMLRIPETLVSSDLQNPRLRHLGKNEIH